MKTIPRQNKYETESDDATSAASSVDIYFPTSDAEEDVCGIGEDEHDESDLEATGNETETADEARDVEVQIQGICFLLSALFLFFAASFFFLYRFYEDTRAPSVKSARFCCVRPKLESQVRQCSVSCIVLLSSGLQGQQKEHEESCRFEIRQLYSQTFPC